MKNEGKISAEQPQYALRFDKLDEMGHPHGKKQNILLDKKIYL